MSPLRPLDLAKDLNPIANLIELCFSPTMDSDGFDYLSQMRRAAEDRAFLRWAPSVAEHASMALSGYVWEEDGAVVGNLSLIPLSAQGKRVYLIANVATHPDHRRKGIARALTVQAIEHVRKHGAAAAWLQVRDDNPAAFQLYDSLGFVERARRSTWQMERSTPPGLTLSDVQVGRRRMSDWPQQEAWLRRAYPPEVAWNLPIQIARYRPSFWNLLNSAFTIDPPYHWAARQDDALLGLVTWQPSNSRSDNLWLAVSNYEPEKAVRCLLIQAVRNTPVYRSVAVNYPADLHVNAFQAAGFHNHLTLIWMELPLQSLAAPSKILEK